jgi:histidinol-phosphatase (PHP family)
MIICDSHIHSEFSSDSDTSLSSIAEKAISLGLPKICLTDHHDIDFIIQEEGGMDFQLDTPAYIKAAKEIQDIYRDKIDIRIGVELGLMNSVVQKARDYASTYKELDFIIGSSHLVRGLDPYYPSFYEGREEIECVRDYFVSILENVSLIDDYDVYGHLDYIVRYCPSGQGIFNIKDYYDVIEEIFRIIIPKGKGIEINTGSLYKNMDYPHPHIDILKLYRQMGGEIITVGSDAHKPEYIGYGFETVARDILENLGYRYYCTFKNRKPEFNPL